MQPQQPQLPSDLGSLEPDGMTPGQGSPNNTPVPVTDPNRAGDTGEPDGMTPGQEGPTPDEIKAHLDSMADEDKAFLAEHLTPEFIRAISLISGDAVGQYLNQYADQDKVLVPVPRKVAEEHMRQQQGAQAPQQPQQQAMPTPAPQAQPAPAALAQGGMMAPMQ